MSFSFHPEAEKEYNEAIDYYEDLEPGLGYDFALEVHSAIKRSIEYSKAWPVIGEDIRRCLVRRFPYGILYSEEKEGIFIMIGRQVVTNFGGFIDLLGLDRTVLL